MVCADHTVQTLLTKGYIVDKDKDVTNEQAVTPRREEMAVAQKTDGEDGAGSLKHRTEGSAPLNPGMEDPAP